MTRFPFFTIRRHRCEPIKPAPPVTNTVFLLPVIFEHYLVSSPSSMMFQSLSSTRVFRDAGRGARRRRRARKLSRRRLALLLPNCQATKREIIRYLCLRERRQRRVPYCHPPKAGHLRHRKKALRTYLYPEKNCPVIPPFRP